MDHFIREKYVVEQGLDHELMLHNTQTDKIHILNLTAKIIWEMADGAHSLTEMEKAVREKFSITDSNEVMHDVERTVNELFKEGLIKPGIT